MSMNILASHDEPSWLDDLNPSQRRAATHGSGPLLVVAGAGTGKTKTLAYRVAYLVSQGVRPERILLLTFTRRAAEEMLRRAAAVCARGREVAGRVWGGTFHATAHRLLRLHAQVIGLSPDFTVMDEGDAEDMMNVVRHDLELAKQDKRFPRKATCLTIYSRCVNGAESIEEVLRRHFPWCVMWTDALKALFRAYVARKRERHVLDYDDLLLYWMQLVDDEAMAREVGGQFDHVLVDEYQDTNTVQARILKGLRRFNDNIMVVGDDAQSIYSFRAATVRNILDFPKEFPGTTIVTLEQNYRSVRPILEATNRLIAQARERYTKDLWSERSGGDRPLLITCKDEAAQDAAVVRLVLKHYEEGIPLRRQAVLFRASHLSDSLEVELMRRNIPYHKYGGLRFLEASHVKDLMAFLRVVENPRDEMAWFRVLQLVEGVGPSTASKAIAHVSRNQFDPRAIAGFFAPAAARPGLAALGTLMEDLVRMGPAQPAAQVQRVREYYEPMIELRYENSQARRRDIEHIEQIASKYRSRRLFLADLTLDPPTSTSDLAGPPRKDEDWLVLSTIHSAKGCEWDAVYLIHASDGCLPSDLAAGSDQEVEEELRLAYVAMTRARNFLYVLWPLRYYHRWSSFTDRHVYSQASRFLTEEVVAACRLERGDVCAAGEPAAGDAGMPARVQRAMDAMWE